MPRRGGKHVVLVKGAEEAMRAFKQEVAADLGLLDKMGPDASYRNLSTVEVGNIGGEMVRRMQAAGEFAILQRFKEGQKRLMPEEVLPDPNSLRSVSNNGNLVDESGTIIEGNMETISHLLMQARKVPASGPASAAATVATPVIQDVVTNVPKTDKADKNDKTLLH